MKYLWFPNKSFNAYSWWVKISGITFSLALIALIIYMITAFFSTEISNYALSGFFAMLGISKLTSLISGIKDKWFIILSGYRGAKLEKIESRMSFSYFFNILENAFFIAIAALYFYPNLLI